MRDFDRVARILVPHRRKAHAVIALFSIFMLVGLPVSLTPADIEAYNIESPELEAWQVIDDEFSGGGLMVGYIIALRDASSIPKTATPAAVADIAPYPGEGVGVTSPIGGILNLTVLREIDRKTALLQAHPSADDFAPIVSDTTGDTVDGVLSITETFRSFMSNESRLTSPRLGPGMIPVPPPTDWTDCGSLSCLSFDDPDVTQAHIDLAAHRMANNSNGAFLRWIANDRAFVSDPTSPVIGPIGGTLRVDGGWEGAIWGAGRWSASASWLLVNFDRDAMEESGWTFQWADAASDSGYVREGTGFVVDPPDLTPVVCGERVESGEGPCSIEWLYLWMEREMRNEDQFTATVLIGESPNVEVNRELYSSLWLIGLMGVAIVVLLYASLRRWSDVAIVGVGLVGALAWMQGLIGWGIIIGDGLGIRIIERSQFSNLLPILILALGIDDSLHALHRYKEERRAGRSPEKSAHISVSKVGRAIMLTSLTTISAFMANLVSGIPALRSFGIEAALGVGSAFVLTGIWVPLLRLDFDAALERRGKLPEPRADELNLVPASWLAATTRTSGAFSPVVLVLALIVSAIATPAMLSLKGDFRIEDFLDEDSDTVLGVNLVNERFSSEGEIAHILLEGDIANPRVASAIVELRNNMDTISPKDPDKFSREATGRVELIAFDEMLAFSLYAVLENPSAYASAGWNASQPDAGVGCPISGIGAPDLEHRGCITFLLGAMVTHGIPAAGGYPEVSAEIASAFIQPERPIDPNSPWLDVDGEPARFHRAMLQFGLRQPEQFATVELALAELHRDMAPLRNITAGEWRERSDIAYDNETLPLTWVMETGSPIMRYVAASRMQNELQGSLGFGVLLCILTLWWGFRPVRSNAREMAAPPLLIRDRFTVPEPRIWDDGGGGMNRGLKPSNKTLAGIAATLLFVIAAHFFMSWSGIPSIPAAIVLATLLFGVVRWQARALALALLSTVPILIVVVWLYGMIAWFGYGLNMVTVAIAAMSLGVGIDYVIHVVARYREERHYGRDHSDALTACGAASGLALVGSGVSDMTGFLVISRSAMGFFSSFGLFSAIMIGLSLIASMVITPAALSLAEMVSRGGLASDLVPDASRAGQTIGSEADADVGPLTP